MNMMKRIGMVVLAVMLMVLCSLGLPALAESANVQQLKISMELSTNEFTGPKEITVTIKLTNTSETDTPGGVSLYYPSGKKIDEFGSDPIAAGQSRSWTGTWEVTQAQLEKGKITFAYVHPIVDENGQEGTYQKNFSKTLNYKGAEAQVEINRIITPTTARKGQEVSVTYEFANTGTVDITDVTIKENTGISKTRGTIDVVPAGETVSHTFTVTMGSKDLTSQATITYKVGSKTTTVKKEDAKIKYGEVKLTAKLAADKKGGIVGDTMKLTLTLKNTGSVDYQSIRVTDPVLGEVFTGVAVPAGETVTLEKSITVTDSTAHQFTITGQDSTGGTVETASERVEVIAMDPAQAVKLEVKVESDRDTVYTLPGTVRFKVYVTNVGGVEAKDVAVTASGVELYEFPSILAGETRSFTRDVNVSMAGKFRFDAEVKNQLGETDVFQSEVLQIAYAQPTAEPTAAPLVTPPAPVYEPIPTDDELPEYVDTLQEVLRIVYRVALVLTAICLALVLIGALRRIANHSRVKDYLERGSTRDYTEQAAKARRAKPAKEEEEQTVSRPIGEDKEATDIPEVEPGDADVAVDGELMEETLRQLYPRGEHAEEAEEENSRRRRSQRHSDEA